MQSSTINLSNVKTDIARFILTFIIVISSVFNTCCLILVCVHRVQSYPGLMKNYITKISDVLIYVKTTVILGLISIYEKHERANHACTEFPPFRYKFPWMDAS